VGYREATAPRTFTEILNPHLIIADKQYIVSSMLYNRIPVLRSERSLTRADLAKATGVNVQTIGFLERGDYSPSLELAFKISGFFKLPVEAVFSPEPFRPLSDQVYEMHRREA
jgi:putative transcriptional regulator